MLCEEGDEIEGLVNSIASGTLDSLSYGVCVHHTSLVRMFTTGQNLSLGIMLYVGLKFRLVQPMKILITC